MNRVYEIFVAKNYTLKLLDLTLNKTLKLIIQLIIHFCTNYNQFIKKYILIG